MATGITNSIMLMLVIMLSINVGLSFTQSAVEELQSDLTVITVTSTPLASYYTGGLENGTSLITSDMLPSDDAIVGDTGNIFTDTYVTLRTWVSSSVAGMGFLVNVLNQPAGFLKDIGVPPAVCLSIQIIWSMMFLLLITAWIMGRN